MTENDLTRGGELTMSEPEDISEDEMDEDEDEFDPNKYNLEKAP